MTLEVWVPLVYVHFKAFNQPLDAAQSWLISIGNRMDLHAIKE